MSRRPRRRRGPAAGSWAAVRADVAAALPAWVVARILVVAALGLAHLIADRIDPSLYGIGTRLHEGLLSWDARWYYRIATRGYEALPLESLRFFPLMPLLARLVSPLVGGHTGLALLLLANGGALAMGALVHRLTLAETGDEALARRAAWFMALMPPFYVMVMGYSEPLAISVSILAFLALRRRRWGWAAVAGLLAGLARPSGVLLAVPAAVEATRGLRAAGGRDRLLRLLPVVSPAVGMAAFLAWTGARFGDPLLPVRLQQASYLRGPVANPLVTVYRAGRRLLGGHIENNPMHLPWLAVLVVLVVVAYRRWPASYGAFATVTLLAATSARFLGSMERYGFGAFPVVAALASATRAQWAERLALVVGAASMTSYAVLAFLNIYVP